MIAFGVHCNLLVVLPIRLKTCKSKGFFQQNKMCKPEKSGASQRFCAHFVQASLTCTAFINFAHTLVKP